MDGSVVALTVKEDAKGPKLMRKTVSARRI